MTGHQTLRCGAKHYGAPPNVMASLQTLRCRTKHYDAPANFTMSQQTLWRATKHYDAPPNITTHRPNFMMPCQILQRLAKRQEASPGFTRSDQAQRCLARLSGAPPNRPAVRQTLWRRTRRYDAPSRAKGQSYAPGFSYSAFRESACRWTIFHSPSSRRNTSVTRKLNGTASAFPRIRAVAR